MGADDLPIDVLREGARLYEQGKYFEAISENRKAIKCYEEMMRVSFPDPVVLNSIGFCHLLLNETDKCKDALRQALELDPQNTEALHNLSMVMFDTGEFEEAEDLARRGIGVERAHAGNWHNLGKVFYATDRLEDARETLVTAIGLAPDRAETHYFMALTLDRLQEEDEAHRSFLRTLELEDDNVQFLIGYSRFLMNLKEFDEAERILRRAVAVEDVNHVALTFLAESLLEQVKILGEDSPEDMVGEAWDLLNRSLELNIGYGMSWYNYGQLFILYRDWENAEKSFRNACEAECENTMAWALHSGVLDRLGRKQEAEEVFEEYRKRSGQA